MQAFWRDWWLREAKGDIQPVEDPGDFGWHDEEGIKRWGVAYYRSGYHPGHLPRPGGVMALTKGEYDDLNQLINGIAWGQWVDYDERKKAETSEQLMTVDYTR